MTVGRMVHLVKSVKKLRLKDPAIRMLVGFDETNTAEAVLAAINSEKIHAVGSSPVELVRYAKKGVPERIKGSLPTMHPTVKKKA